MSYTLTCYCLFDITPTGTVNRSRPAVDEDIDIWVYKRNTQCNFDTVLQAISLRSQPELLTMPSKIEINFEIFDNFGFLFQQHDKETYPCWTFNFTIQHPSVFDDGITELGALYSDCDTIHMIKTNTILENLPKFLDTTPELKNIHFEVTANDE